MRSISQGREDAVQSDREREIKKIYDHLTKYHGFEQLGAINYSQPQSSAAMLRQMANIDVQKLKTDLPDLDTDLLTRIGFFREIKPDQSYCQRGGRISPFRLVQRCES